MGRPIDIDTINSKTIQAAGERVLHRRRPVIIAKPFTTEIPHWSEFDREKNYAAAFEC
jgi:hypothetical protein